MEESHKGDIWDHDHHTDDDGHRTDQIGSYQTMELEREWKARRDEFWNAGYREGIEAGKHETVQEGFNEGYAIGVDNGYKWGVLRGAAMVLKREAEKNPSLKGIQHAESLLQQVKPEQICQADTAETSGLPKKQESSSTKRLSDSSMEQLSCEIRDQDLLWERIHDEIKKLDFRLDFQRASQTDHTQERES